MRDYYSGDLMKAPMPCTTVEPAELLLRRSFVRHIPDSEEIAERVVHEFVNQGGSPPQVDTERLQTMIWQTLAKALDHHGDRRAFRTSCRQLGKIYAELGLKVGDFDTLAQLLLGSLDLNSDEREAWQAFIARIGREITESGRRAPSPGLA